MANINKSIPSVETPVDDGIKPEAPKPIEEPKVLAFDASERGSYNSIISLPKPEGKTSTMEVADAWVQLTDKGNNVMLPNVTPAEVQLLRAMHGASVKCDPIHALDEKGDKKTGVVTNIREIVHNARAEKLRLSKHYNPEIIEKVFPGIYPQMPVGFADVAGFVPDDKAVTSDNILRK